MKASTASPEENLGVELGSVLVGKYRIDAILGQGGMGVVARATHLHMQEPVAIKFLRADIAGSDEAVQRFLREATAASKLRGEHVARVLDVGTLDTGLPYLVMEHLDGIDLDAMLFQSGRIAPPLAVEFVVQACEALAEAHALGIVHRDVKPSNFFVTWRGDGSPLVKLLDFGISKAQSNTDVSLTQTQSMLGTPAYMSPEQMRSARTVDARTDIWSLGAVLFELCEGRKPFEAASFSEMCVMVAVDPPSRMTAPTPPSLEAVVIRALQKTPEARFADVGQFARAMAPFARDRDGAVRTADRIDRQLARAAALAGDGSGPVAVPALRLETPPPRHTTPGLGAGPNSPAATPWIAAANPTLTTEPDRSPRPSRRWAWIALALISVALGAVIVVGQLTSSADHAPPSSTAPGAAGSAPTGGVSPGTPTDTGSTDTGTTGTGTTGTGTTGTGTTGTGTTGTGTTGTGTTGTGTTGTGTGLTDTGTGSTDTGTGSTDTGIGSTDTRVTGTGSTDTGTATDPTPVDPIARPKPGKKPGRKPGKPRPAGGAPTTTTTPTPPRPTPPSTGGDDVYGRRK